MSMYFTGQLYKKIFCEYRVVVNRSQNIVISGIGWTGSIYRGRLQSDSGSRYGNQTGGAGRVETVERCYHRWRPAPAAAGMPSIRSYPS